MPKPQDSCSRRNDGQLAEVIKLVPRDPIGTVARLMDGHDPVFELVRSILADDLDPVTAERCAVRVTLALDECCLLDNATADPTP